MRWSVWMLLVGCANPLPMGDLAKDRVPLADAPELAHLAQATSAETVMDLFDDPEIELMPDPTAWFESSYDDRTMTAPTDATTLNVLSYNVGLLDRKSIVGRIYVPNLEERLVDQRRELFTGEWDVLLLQEVWEWDDYLSLEEAAIDGGYVGFGGSSNLHKQHGLAIFVKADMVEVGGQGAEVEVQFHKQRKLEKFPGPNLKRAYLAWTVTLPESGRKLTLFNTHMTPFYSFDHVRNEQARELGVAVSELAGDHVAIVGGDLNAGYAYAHDAWVDGKGKRHEGWWANAFAVPLLNWYGELKDVRNEIAPAEELEISKGVPYPATEAWIDEPYAGTGWCDNPIPELTAHDCLPLHHESYAGEEQPARLDHVLFRDDARGTYVTDVGLAYDGDDYLSDHAGVYATFQIGNP